MSLSSLTNDYIYDTVYSFVIKNNLGGLLDDSSNHFLLLQSLAVVSVVSRFIYSNSNPVGYDSLHLVEILGNPTVYNIACSVFVYLVSQALMRHGNSDPVSKKKRSMSVLIAMALVIFLKTQLNNR